MAWLDCMAATHKPNVVTFVPVIWSRLKPPGKFLFTVTFASYSIGFFLLIGVVSGVTAGWLPESATWPIATVTVFGLFASVAIGISSERAANDVKFEAAEERVRENPDKTRYAWDLARLKLESYLDRNLRQVSAIFYLTSFVMACGMALIGFGVWRSLNGASALAPSALAAASGIVVQIIGSTFLIIFRSTMEQARNYVVVLERINAVGMSINILETIDDSNADRRNSARAELARDLLKMYDPSAAQRGAQ